MSEENNAVIESPAEALENMGVEIELIDVNLEADEDAAFFRSS